VIIFNNFVFYVLVAGIVSLRIKALPAQRKAYFLNNTWLLMRKNLIWLKDIRLHLLGDAARQHDVSA